MGAALDSLQADREALLEICSGFGTADWEAASGCAGWSVQDIIAHVGALFWLVVDPSKLPDVAGLPTERAQDVYVEARRSWSSEQVLADYEAVSTQAIVALAGLEAQDFELPLGDLGTYPAALLPNAFAFDHYTHIRADLFGPRGPISGEPPASDELRLVPTLDWIAAAAPQQNADALASLAGALDLVVTGPGARTIRLGDGAVVGEIRSSAPDFVRWVTQRSTWEQSGVSSDGDEAALATGRRLRVF
jgi:uncharacterized protein (TIGR03083 family)